MMKAIVVDGYGGPEVLVERQVPKPIPANNEILIRLRATSVTPAECELRSFSIPIPILFWLPLRIIFGMRKHLIIGQEFAGVVEEVGDKVTQYKVGDRVFGAPGMQSACYAEYLAMPETGGMAIIPSDITYEQAVSVVAGGINALHFLQQANLKQGAKVLVNGAAGVFGTIACQVAGSMGATVTAVDEQDKLERISHLPIARTFDYKTQDFTQEGPIYDAVFDVVGKGVWARCVSVLKQNGTLLMVNPAGIGQMVRAWLANKFTKRNFRFAFADEGHVEMPQIAALLQSKQLVPVIDRVFPLEQSADAHRYVESGVKVGTVVLSIAE